MKWHVDRLNISMCVGNPSTLPTPNSIVDLRI